MTNNFSYRVFVEFNEFVIRTVTRPPAEYNTWLRENCVEFTWQAGAVAERVTDYIEEEDRGLYYNYLRGLLFYFKCEEDAIHFKLTFADRVIETQHECLFIAD